MSDIIKLLPESVANQIAAGEVIQRPASVVKELCENALDAEADEITVMIKEAGKSLIQVIDNGRGMSETDARMAFERHATSKINKAEDLFSIKSMGFRGEALASIAAVAQVELRTRQRETNLGTLLRISGSELITQEPVQCSTGSSFSVKNLFYNIPARRKFLKKNSTEFGHILNEFRKVALTRPDVEFTLYDDEQIVYKLPKSSLLQRITALFGKPYQIQLIPVLTQSSLINISGFIGKPDLARSKQTENYFFVNNRYMKHAYFNKAVVSAYDQIIPKESAPAYFLYFEISPDTIDINIHPQKTEINFENSQDIYQIIRSCVKESLGKFNIAPSIDFDTEGSFEFTRVTSETVIRQPQISYNPEYNPFNTNQKHSTVYEQSKTEKDNLGSWEDLVTTFENKEAESDTQTNLYSDIFSGKYIQLKTKYILTPVKSGLMLIDQKRAHTRILYDELRLAIKNKIYQSQKLLYPEELHLQPDMISRIYEMLSYFENAGFRIGIKGKTSLVIEGVPSEFSGHNAKALFGEICDYLMHTERDAKEGLDDFTARLLAQSASISYGQKLSVEEMNHLTERLLASASPNYCPSGKLIISILNFDEMEKKFNN